MSSSHERFCRTEEKFVQEVCQKPPQTDQLHFEDLDLALDLDWLGEVYMAEKPSETSMLKLSISLLSSFLLIINLLLREDEHQSPYLQNVPRRQGSTRYQSWCVPSASRKQQWLAAVNPGDIVPLSNVWNTLQCTPNLWLFHSQTCFDSLIRPGEVLQKRIARKCKVSLLSHFMLKSLISYKY